MLHGGKRARIMAVSLKKKIVAIGEKGEKPSISLYKLEPELKHEKVLSFPFETKCKEFLCLSFAHDGKHLVAVTGEPEYMMYYYNWQSSKIESYVKAINIAECTVTDVALHPTDSTLLVFVGKGMFRMMSLSENVWRQYGFQKAQAYSLISVCWLNDDRIVAATDNGMLLIVQSSDLIGIYNLRNLNQIEIIENLSKKQDFSKGISAYPKGQEKIEEEYEIHCCLVFSKGILFSIKFGKILYFEKVSSNLYVKRTTFLLEGNNEIKNINVDPSGQKLICSSNSCKIYWAELSGKDEEVKLKIFGKNFQKGRVTGISSCLWKPLIATCSSVDNSIAIWNYLTMNLILLQTFIQTVNCVSLHPTGLYGVIGFFDKIRFVLILMDRFEFYREINVRDSGVVSFSNNGHKFACTESNNIYVFSSISFERLAVFQGHSSIITDIKWMKMDIMLYSCSDNGVIYEWNTDEMIRVNDIIIQNDVQITSLQIDHNRNQLLSVSKDGLIRQIHSDEILKEKKLSTSLNAVVLNKENGKLYIGGDEGVILCHKYPMAMKEDDQHSHFMHNTSIIKICLLNGGKLLISCAIDGSICFWNVFGHNNKDDEFSEEILIKTDELLNINESLKYQSVRINELKSEYEFEKKHLKKQSEEMLAQFEEKYAKDVKQLKDKIKTLDKEHAMEVNKINLEIMQMKQSHTSEMDEMDTKYDTKLLYQFHKYDSIRNQMQLLQNDYKQKIEEMNENSKETLNKLTTEYELKLSELEKLIKKLKEEKEVELEEKSKLINELIESNKEGITNMEKEHELQLKNHKTTIKELNNQIGILKKKIIVFEEEKNEFEKTINYFKDDLNKMKLNKEKLMKKIEMYKMEIKEKEENMKKMNHHNNSLKNQINQLNDVINLSKIKEEQSGKILEEKNEQIDKLKNEIIQLKRESRHLKEEKCKLSGKLLNLSDRLESRDMTLKMYKTNKMAICTFMKNLTNELYEIFENQNQTKYEIKMQIQKIAEKIVKQNK